MLKGETIGQIVFHIIDNDIHMPLIKGKANRGNIEDQIIIGLYSQKIPPINGSDVDMIVELVDELIENDAVNFGRDYLQKGINNEERRDQC
jgi:hypothetical protein|tara:strand:+ start:208 stop:480 length:273 start_codon:yes stop_codon:yes gene_type:complete